jgi:hypothetical protein
MDSPSVNVHTQSYEYHIDFILTMSDVTSTLGSVLHRIESCVLDTGANNRPTRMFVARMARL